MKSIEMLYVKPQRTFLMSDRVRQAEVAVGTFLPANEATMGVFAISKNDSLVLFADANGAEKETLVLAAEIVHSHMYHITNEALRVAVLIAKGSEETDDTTLLETAKKYLAQGMTVSKVRNVVTEARDIEAMRINSRASTETTRAQKLLQVGHHLRQASSQPQLAAA